MKWFLFFLQKVVYGYLAETSLVCGTRWRANLWQFVQDAPERKEKTDIFFVPYLPYGTYS